MNAFPPNRAVQQAAKRVLTEIGEQLTPASTESSIAAFARQRLAALGFPGTWYHGCPALVLLGGRSRCSVSGRDYTPGHERVGERNLVTVDLSPRDGTRWGDCARSFAIEHGRHTEAPASDEFRDGFAALAQLHREVLEFVSPETTCSELCRFAQRRIASMGYENLDFLGNIGHSIETTLADRFFIDPNTHARLSDMPCFTFEPHIARPDSPWGFKHEDIYYFDQRGALRRL
ncbi:MAG: M24 family metallopeptidase [Planctomycetota bacterium]